MPAVHQTGQIQHEEFIKDATVTGSTIKATGCLFPDDKLNQLKQRVKPSIESN